MRGRPAKSIRERLLANTERPSDPSKCWIWIGLKNKQGYGKLTERVDKGSFRTVFSHRAMYELEHGPIPPGHYVCHRCDTPSCVNPAHLFAGSAVDNNLDKIRKGRQSRGEVIRGKLTSDIVRSIRAEYRANTPGAGSPALAKKYGISHRMVLSIVNRETWAHVEDAQIARR